MLGTIQFCNFSSPKFLIFSDSVPLFVYYSHFPVLIISLFVGFFIFKRGRENLQNRLISLISFFFGLWVFFSLITWSANRSDLIMFVWALTILIEPCIYFLCLYLLEITHSRKDIKVSRKLIWLILYLPLFLVGVSGLMFDGFDVSVCSPIESTLSGYSYVLEVTILIWIIKTYVSKYQYIRGNKKRKHFSILFVGTILFLTIFTLGNLVGSVTDNWNIAQVGIFGFHLFIGSIAFLIVKYKSFGIVVHTSQVLIATFLMMVLSLSFFRQLLLSQRLLIIMTFLLCTLIGYFYIKFAKNELYLREKLERQTQELKTANRKLKELNELKSDFISLATHHIGTPLTAIKGYVSFLEEETVEKKFILNKIQYLTNNLVNIIRDFLDVHKIDQNEVEYYFENVNIKDLILEIIDECNNIDKKENKFVCTYTHNQKYFIQADREKIKQALQNIFENINKYAQAESVKVRLNTNKGFLFILVSDTAIRNLPMVSSGLLRKFTESGDRNEANIIGQGLGLYLAKQIILAHSGNLKIEFKDGENGVNFKIKLPSQII